MGIQVGGLPFVNNIFDDLAERGKDFARTLGETGRDAAGGVAERVMPAIPDPVIDAGLTGAEVAVDVVAVPGSRLPVVGDFVGQLSRIDLQAINDNEGLEGDWLGLWRNWLFEQRSESLGEWETVEVDGERFDSVTITDPTYTGDLASRDQQQALTDEFFNQFENPQVGQSLTGLWQFTGDGTTNTDTEHFFERDPDTGELRYIEDEEGRQVLLGGGGQYGAPEWFLGSYRTTIEVVAVDEQTGELTLEYTVENNSGWESGTRVPAEGRNLGLPEYLLPNQQPASGLPLGSNFQQNFVWQQTFDANQQLVQQPGGGLVREPGAPATDPDQTIEPLAVRHNEPAPEEIAEPGDGGSLEIPEQLVIVPNDGVSIYGDASRNDERVGVFRHGAFIEPTGQTNTTQDGTVWVEVTGVDNNGRPTQGWVPAQYTVPHAGEAGAMSNGARINPELEEQRYEGHTVVPGDTIWDIAHERGVSFEEMLALNDHIINPDLIFPDDVVYIPGTGIPQPEEVPDGPPQDDAPIDDPCDGDSSGEGAPSGGSPSGGSPSSDNDGSSSGSGDSGSPSQLDSPNNVPGRPDLDEILNGYQMETDPGGMVEWQPNGGLQGAAYNFGGFVDNFIPGVDVPDPITVTAREAALLDTLSLREVREIQQLRANAYAIADEFYPASEQVPDHAADHPHADEWATNDGHNDAFRHAYASAAMTNRFDSEFAEAFTTAHEGTSDNWAAREAMDLYNNEVGRRIAEENPNASDEELAQFVQGALEDGELLVIDADGNLAWSNQVAVGQHGIAGDQELPGVTELEVADSGGPSGSIS